MPEIKPPKDHTRKVRKTAAIAIAAILLIYAGFFRLAFDMDWLKGSGGVVSMSFIFAVPFACGALSIALGRLAKSDSFLIFGFIVPLFTIIFGLCLCLVAGIEAIICIIMAAPILLVAVVLGSLIAHTLLPKHEKAWYLQVTICIFLPFLAAWFESALHWPSETKSITNIIDIEAPAETIWPLIASVSAIHPSEIRDSWIYKIGFPKPIAATLDHHGVGGIRTATFERDVSFFEVITRWDPQRSLAFSIEADPAFIPATSFDQHIIVGGRFYDVLDGTYRIETIGKNTSRLHLTSNHRLSTRFNSYASWWSVQIMDQIQGSILEVIRSRAETED